MYVKVSNLKLKFTYHDELICKVQAFFEELFYQCGESKQYSQMFGVNLALKISMFQ